MENVPEEISSAITESITEQTSSQNLYKEIPANSATAWGLSTELADKKNMQEYEGTDDDDKMNGEGNKFSKKGCKMASTAKMISDALGIDVSLIDINSYDSNNDGCMSEEEIASAFRSYLSANDSEAELKTDYWKDKLSKEKLNEIVAKEEGTTYVLGQAKDVFGGDHWVVLTGYRLNDNGQIQFNYSGSSVNDAKQHRNYILGNKMKGQDNFYTITKIETYTLIKH